MFFVFGMSTKEKDIDFQQTVICPVCEAYGRLEIISLYNYFSLFFIPILKWNKKYYVQSTCCGSLFTIDKDLGKSIENGRRTKIEESELILMKVNHKKGYELF